MRKYYFTVIASLTITYPALAQFTTSGNITYTTNNIGIGTTYPNGNLDVNGSIFILGSSSNRMSRPPVGNARITGEIASYSAAGSIYDDGFLRLSAGAGSTPQVKTFIDLTGYSTVPDMDRNIVLGTAGTERIRITSSGNVGIGTASPDSKLSVSGTIHSQAVKVDMTSWGDNVFNKDYDLNHLKDVATYIENNHHLPGVPSEDQVIKNGIDLGVMNKILLKKIEELTLYLIEKDKEVMELKQQAKINISVDSRLKELEKLYRKEVVRNSNQ